MRRLNLVCAFLFSCSANSLAEPPAPIRIVQEKPESGHFVKTYRGYMIEYEDRIPGTSITFRMVPVPHKLSATQRKESIKPFWIGKYEVTMEQYREYMKLCEVFQSLEAQKKRVVNDETQIDAVTAPSAVYSPSDRFGKIIDPEYRNWKLAPAISMTRFAARQYTKWLSLLGEKQYRLPTESEWMHACLAGTDAPWSFGDDAAKGPQYCHCDAEAPLPIGSKKPNSWGIHDMHGNVAEWVLLKPYVRDPKAAPNIGWRGSLEQMVMKGGDRSKTIEHCRASIRETAAEELWNYDPNIPLSTGWLANGNFGRVGFRIISPLEPLPRDEIEKYWSPDTKFILDAVDDRNRGSRSVQGLVDKKLPNIVDEVLSRQ